MKHQSITVGQNRQKKVIVNSLYLGAMFIMFLGFFFSAFSVLNDIRLQVLNVSIPGFIFGMLVVYLGIRYYFMISDFKIEFYKSTEKFSWSNFKKVKSKKGSM